MKIISTLKKLVKPGPSNRNSLNRGMPKKREMSTSLTFSPENPIVNPKSQKINATRSILWAVDGEFHGILEVAA